MIEKKTSAVAGNCKVISIFKTNQEEDRKKALQVGIANIICRVESNDKLKYVRVK